MASADLLPRQGSSANFVEDRHSLERQLSACSLAAYQYQLQQCLHIGQANPRQPSREVPSPDVPTLQDESPFPRKNPLKKSSSMKTDDSEEEQHYNQKALTQICSSDSVDGSVDSVDTKGHHIFHWGFRDLVKDAYRRITDQVNDLRYDVSDGCSDIIQSFSHLLPHQNQQAAQCEIEDAFTVHLPSQFHNGAPVHLGVHLRHAMEGQEGYHLTRVIPETVAHKVGLREHDILTHLNEVELKREEVSEVVKHFMRVEKTFSLTILREVGQGEHNRLVQITLHVTLSVDLAERTFEIEVIVTATRYFYLTSSGNCYITQDEDNKSEVYLNSDSTGTVTMGPYHDDRGTFQFDLYAPTSDGELCVIRNTSSNQVYDVVAGKMATMNDIYNVEVSCLLNKKYREDQSYVFESVQQKSHFLINSSGQLQLGRYYSGPSSVPSSGSFQIVSC